MFSRTKSVEKLAVVDDFAQMFNFALIYVLKFSALRKENTISC